MRGQLWEKCRCGDEPICCACEKCKRHCHCSAKPAALKKIDTTPAEPYRKGVGQGFGSTEDGDV